MKPAMDHELGQTFKWQSSVYQVIQPVDDSSGELKVQRIAQLMYGKWQRVINPFPENFNTLCEVESGELQVTWKELTDA